MIKIYRVKDDEEPEHVQDYDPSTSPPGPTLWAVCYVLGLNNPDYSYYGAEE